jgi:hypothetical protein
VRAKMSRSPPVPALNRILDALEHELLEASDEELLAAAHELGMRPDMKGSAAFIGILGPVRLQLEEFFDVDTLRAMRRTLGKDRDL